jgi:FkbM family methyltransferase
MILQAFKSRFEAMKSQGLHIQYVLDIGAYRGDFTETIKSVWPTALVRQFEADERQKSWLQKDAFIGLLGDEEKDNVDFFTLDENKITTGSSIFKENTQHYNDNTTVILKKSMSTIDALNKKHHFYGDWKKYGLIKIDTQGSELLILEGSSKFLSEQQPKYILLECSIIEYNVGAPKINDVIGKMYKLGYVIKDIFDLSYGNYGNLIQVDVLFERLKNENSILD